MERPRVIPRLDFKVEQLSRLPFEAPLPRGPVGREALADPHLYEESELPFEVKKVLDSFLMEPMLELKSRPSHRFRSELVEVGYRLAGGSSSRLSDKNNLALCAASIEYLHLGSLIVDDVQDGSEVRRQGQALHLMLGTPHAIGVGNWLYFYALRLLGGLDLGGSRHAHLYATYAKAVELAHYGQIMDLCVKVDEVSTAEIEALCHECSRFKTGSLVMLALVLGALVGRADPERLRLIESFGYELGSYLQRHNDIGNIATRYEQEKRWEDLAARKPSFVWAFILHRYGQGAFREVLDAVKKLPDSRELEDWFAARGFLAEAQAWVEARFTQVWRDFAASSAVEAKDLESLHRLKERIGKAYV